MSTISPVHQSSNQWRRGTRSLLRREGFVEKVGFEPGGKEWRSSGCWEWWWQWQRWVDKWMRRWIETCKVDKTAAVATVTTRPFAARVQQLATVAEEPGAALAERRRAGVEPARRAAITTPISGRDDRPALVTITPAATRRRPTSSSIIGATATNRLWL